MKSQAPVDRQSAPERPPDHEELEDDSPAPPVVPEPPEPPLDDFGDDVFASLEPGPMGPGQVLTVCGVRLTDPGRVYIATVGDFSPKANTRVVIETDRGVMHGSVVVPPRREMIEEPPKMRVLRGIEASDSRTIARNQLRAREALGFLRERARAKRLQLKVVSCDILPGGGRAHFYFSSEGRIDFRDLLRDLSQKLHMRIEMRQVGLRDAAKKVGGIGDCGLELCCSTFLPRFEPISIRMAKDQGLPLNPSRVSGQCGRLKCCLIYEHAEYAKHLKNLPRLGKAVTTPKGDGRVQELDVLRQRVKVSFPDGAHETFEAPLLKWKRPQPQPQKPKRDGQPQ